MALTRITKGVIKPNEDFETRNVNSTGIVTATELDVNGNADISGSLSVGGVLTYEDVTSIDSVGIITARSGLVSPNADIDDFVSVGNNIHLGNAGVITATSFVGSGAALTGIDATAIKDSGGNVKVQAQASGAMYTGIHTFSSGAEVGSNIKLGNAGVITATSFVGSGAALTGIDATAVKDTGGNVKIQAQASGAVYTGIHTFVTLKSTSGTFTGDIDVDGHTNLDNLSVAGVSTFAGTLNASTVSSTAFIASGDLDVDGQTNLDNVDVVGIMTVTTNTQYHGYKLSNGTNLVGELVGLSGSNDTGALALWSGGTKYVQLSAVGNSFLNGGNVAIAKDLDVDGHTNLDNVSVAGVSTFSGILDATNTPASIRVAQDIQHKGDADTKITFPAADTVSVETGGSERVRITSDGRVLIGATSGGNADTDDLIISGSGKRGITICSTNSSETRLVFADGLSGTNAVVGQVLYDHSANRMDFYTSTNRRVSITNNSYVGINTITPGRMVHVFSGTTGHPILLERGDTSNTQIEMKTGGATRGYMGCSTTANFMVYDNDASDIQFQVLQNGNIETGNINSSGIVTATTVQQRQSKYYGVTTTERNALSPSEGDIVYNTTANKHEFYTSSNQWAAISATAPAFDNASGSLATFYSESRSTTTLSSQPTASGDAPITYSIASGSLPSGMSINSSTGVISGTPNAVGSDTTSNFTVQASNLGGAVTRDYSITVKAPVTTNYSYTGSTVTWSKPNSNVKRVLFRMWGGAGTHGTCTSNSQYPGRGGKTEGVINVESHSSLYLQVGEAGGNTNSGPNGGWPNGGNGNISHQCKGSGGGGSSNIYHSSGTGSYTYIVAVAGGGGSVSHGNPNSNGGDGGGTNGQSSNRGGGGASQNAGGSQGSTPCGNTGNSGTGTRLQGGTAGTGSGCTNAGAGGGGGWWGGGAGGNSNSGNTYGGGGGGSGYFDTSLVSGGSTKQASESGWETNRPSGIGGRASYGDNNRGGHGYITLIY